MIPASLAFLAGQLLSAWLSPATFWIAGASAAALIAGATSSSITLRAAARCLLAGTLGLWLAARAAEPPGECFLPPPGAGQKLWMTAVIDDAAIETADGYRLRVRAEASARQLCGTVLLTVLGNSAPPQPGDRVRIHASIRRPRNFRNPRAYDQSGVLARKGIWITGHATGDSIEHLGREPAALRLRIAAERVRIGRLITESLPPAEAGLLRSLVVGDQAAVAPDLWRLIAEAGLAHLLSISGLHIAAVWGAGFLTARWMASRSEWLLLFGNVRALAAVVALPPAIAYGLLAGLGVPTERSLATTAFLVAALTLGREGRPGRLLCLTAVGLAIAHPGSPLDVSFQLSFASVLALLSGAAWWMGRVERRPAASYPRWKMRLGLALVVPASALAGTAPLVALHFNRLTPIGLLTNPLLVPACGTPATLLGLLGAAASFASEDAARALFALAYWPLAALRVAAAAAVELPLASLVVPTPTLLEVALVYAWLALPWAPARLRRPAAAILFSLSLVDAAAWTDHRFLHRDLRVRFLDVGQGDSAVVELPGGKVLVIDGGGFTRSRFDVGERVVAPYLWSRKILRVDFLVASHGDWDHQGGLHFLARELAPRELWLPARDDEAARLEPLARIVAEGGGVVRRFRRGQRPLHDGELTIETLHPPPEGDFSANDSSLVLRIALRSASFLFPGDVGAKAERMLAEGNGPGAIGVLKVSHHGSATSSREEFLRRANPSLAVVSAGLGNPFGFPSPDVVDRYRRLGIPLLRTDLDGSVSVSTDGERLRVRAFARASPIVCSGSGAVC